MDWRHQVCPGFLAGFLSSRIRRFIHNPEQILDGYVRSGDTLMDIGCGPGFFTIPMARMVGERGTVWAVDIQDEMLELTRRAAERAGVLPRIRLHKGSGSSLMLDLPPVVSFALVFHVLHETTDQASILKDLSRVLRPGGLVLLAEPRGIVGPEEFRNSVEIAIGAGFAVRDLPSIRLSRSVLLEKNK
jgi:ubiquinone/menaquinone biosynthesis C-methylase UbiE